jgi:DNA (cytosine-5)-methyltransferase 1
MTTVAACEAIDWRRDLFSSNFPGVKLYDDLRTLTGAQLRTDGIAKIDLVAGSPPCIEFSSVNTKRRGRGLDADDLFLHAVRIVDEVRPRWVAFENSPEIKTRGYDRIADALEAIGYPCWPFVVCAAHAGAAHRRARAFVVACDPSQSKGRPTRQSRSDGGVALAADTDESRQHAEPVDGEMGGLVGAGPDGIGRSPLHPLASLGPAGAQPLGRHLRAYHGLPARLAERCREAYGDAVLPQLTEAVGRAIIAVEQAGVL